MSKGVFGTTRFLSPSAHSGFEQCRADDLLALGHILISFYKNGVLPWDMEPLPEFECDDKDPLIYQKTMKYQKDQSEWDKKYLQRKQEVTHEILTYGMPAQFIDYFRYCSNLRFEQRPDYEHLVSIFEQLYKDLGFPNDDEYDWIIHKKRLIERRNAREAEEKRLKLL